MHGGLIEVVDAVADQFVVAATYRFFQRADSCVNSRALFGRKIRSLLSGQRLLRCSQDRLRFSARFDRLAFCKILLGILDRLFEHALDLRVAEAIAGLYFNGALLSRTRV